MEALKYPIGRYEPQPYNEELKQEWIIAIRDLPQLLEYAITNLDEHQLDTPYREGGWTVKQLVHHVADSHMNAYMRFKLGLTENTPLVKAYDEKAWAEMNDSKVIPVNVSLTLLHALHNRWHAILEKISREEWDRNVIHSASNKEMTLWFLLGMYAWHSRHHVAHITALRERMGW